MGAMCAVRMHEDELAVDVPLVGRLIAEQFPQWAGLPLRRLESSGTENAMFRLGADKVVRLPRHPRAVEAIAHELHWLPRLAPALPTEKTITRPLVAGTNVGRDASPPVSPTSAGTISSSAEPP